MTATVSILDTTTGETHLFFDIDVKTEDDICDWTDGDYSCDCNRSVRYGKAFDEVPCGDRRYRVSIFCEGRFVYHEDA